MKREDVLRKIKGLLKTSTGKANENESHTAFLMARKLMAKYDIDEMELSKENGREERTLFEGIVEFKVNEPKIIRWFENYLAILVAKHFKVKLYRDMVDGGKKVLIFYGYEEDCDFAREIYFMLLDAMKSHTKNYLELYYMTDGRYIEKTAKHTNQIKDSYMNGFMSGLDTAFENQNKEIFEEYGLVVTTNAIVNQSFELFTQEKGMKTSKVKKASTVNADAYYNGKNRGEKQDVQVKKRLEI